MSVVAARTVRHSSLQSARGVIKFPCGGKFANLLEAGTSIHSELHGVIHTFFMPEVVDLLERPLQLLRVGGSACAVLSLQVFPETAGRGAGGLHPLLVIGVFLSERCHAK